MEFGSTYFHDIDCIMLLLRCAYKYVHEFLRDHMLLLASVWIVGRFGLVVYFNASLTVEDSEQHVGRAVDCAHGSCFEATCHMLFYKLCSETYFSSKRQSVCFRAQGETSFERHGATGSKLLRRADVIFDTDCYSRSWWTC